MNSLLIAANIVKRVLKSPMTVIAMIVLPIVLIFTILAAVKEPSAPRPKAGVADMDGGTPGAKVAEFLGAQGLEVVPANGKDPDRMIRNKKASVVVVIPEGFSEAIAKGERTAVRYYMNAEDAGAAGLIQSLNRYISGLRASYAAAEAIARSKGGDPAEIAGEILKDIDAGQAVPGSEPAGAGGDGAGGGVANPAIGFAVIFMMIFIFTTIGIILDDKKKLTLARMFVSPVKEWEIILGNLLGSLALGSIQLIPLVLSLKLSFGIASFYKVAEMFVIFFCFLIAIIGIGIGISGLIKNSFNPATIIATVITPTSILGGCFIPDSMLPGFINKIGYAVPQKWVMGALQSVLAGEGLEGVLLNLVIIMLFGIAFATFGLKTLRPLND